MNLQDMLEHIPSDRRVAILLRHAQRESIDAVGDSVTAQLTEAGRAAARDLGSRLARFAPLRCFHSPIQRCEETALQLINGARSAGAQAKRIDAHPDLGGPYMQDWNTVMGHVLEQGAFRFTRDWFAGRLPAGLAQAPDLAARQQVQFLVDQLARPDWQGCTIGVSHDWNLLLIRRFFLGLDASEVGWPDYLEGVVASLGADGLELRWGDRMRAWRLPLPERISA